MEIAIEDLIGMSRAYHSKYQDGYSVREAMDAVLTEFSIPDENRASVVIAIQAHMSNRPAKSIRETLGGSSCGSGRDRQLPSGDRD